ncbi:MAG: putative SOS response-associated peptidase YedK [Gammaproteobacteria bacterium]|jgi:putative SOS response-associated peptidase YedK
MCGRYALRTSVPELARTLGAEPLAECTPRYNIAPTQQVPVLHAAKGSRALHWMRWGLVPAWSKGPDARYAMHNARIEGVTGKPAYRGPIRRRRCLIPASGWYEWQNIQGRKQPWLITHRDQELVCFAGLWDHWQKDGESIVSCSILTAAALAPIDAVHSRMPIIAAPTEWDQWLDPKNDNAQAALDGLHPLHADALHAIAVSSHVNNARHDEPLCLEPLQATES